MSSIVAKQDIILGLQGLGIIPEMAVEVHSSLNSFGYVQGGAITLIEALMEVVGELGSIVMPSFRISDRLPLDEIDKELGLTCKIKILKCDEERSGMGIVSDTFRKMKGVITDDNKDEIFRVSAWGKDADVHSKGFQHLIDTGGYALLLGVDIYKLSAMHYVENNIPVEITNVFKPSEKARMQYPEDEWLIEGGEPPIKAWYTIQNRAYEKGLIKDGIIGCCKCMFFKVKDVIELYRQALENDPLGLYGLH